MKDITGLIGALHHFWQTEGSSAAAAQITEMLRLAFVAQDEEIEALRRRIVALEAKVSSLQSK